eukprot:19867-Pleurochrysis_carterae.AAC.1
MDTLMRVHGTQLLVDGVFNADTHAGNFLLMPDDRVALIDYGATKRLSTQERLSACYLYAALRRHAPPGRASARPPFCSRMGAYTLTHPWRHRRF